MNSKWNYFVAGINTMVVLFFLLAHDAVFMTISAFFVWFNWYIAEEKRRAEEAELLAKHEATKEDTPE